MHRTPLRVAALLGALVALAPAAWAYGPGDQVADFRAADEAGRQRALADAGDRPVVVVFWGSACPGSRAYAARLGALANRFGDRVTFLGVASNRGDDAQRVGRAKREQGLSFPILIDADGSIAQAFGAQVTPTVYVIDARRRVRYVGAIDDDPNGEQGGRAEAYLAQAVQAVLGGQDPAPARTSVRGYRISR